MTITELKKIKPMVEQIVESKLLELLGDPDNGLELRENIRQRLKKSLHSKSEGVTVQKVGRKLFLENIRLILKRGDKDEITS